MKTKIYFITLLFGIILNTNAQIPSEGLIGYWPFNGNANDESGNGHNGSIYGATLSNDRFGFPNQAYSFNGSDDYITIQSNDFPVGNDPFVVTGWFQTTNTGGNNGWGGNVVFSYGNPNVHLMIYAGNIGIHSREDDFIGPWLAPGNFVADGVFHFFLYEYSKNIFRFILDGEIIIDQEIDLSTSYYPFQIGARKFSPCFNFDGIIDDIRVYNRLLSDTEIDSLYTQHCLLYFADTSTYIVSDVEFETHAPKVYLESKDTLVATIGGCDSIINHFSKYIFEPNHCTDTLIVYDSIAVTDTLIINVTITGINPPDNFNTLRVYPNPAKDIIYINTGTNFQQMTDYKIKIFSSTGSVIFESNITQQLFDIDVSDFGQNGIYFIQIVDNSNQITDIRKILLE